MSLRFKGEAQSLGAVKRKEKKEKKKAKKVKKKRKKKSKKDSDDSDSDSDDDDSGSDDDDDADADGGAVPKRIPGTGRIVASGPTIQGMNTKFLDEVKAGDFLVLCPHPTSLVEERCVVVNVLGQTSLLLAGGEFEFDGGASASASGSSATSSGCGFPGGDFSSMTPFSVDKQSAILERQVKRAARRERRAERKAEKRKRRREGNGSSDGEDDGDEAKRRKRDEGEDDGPGDVHSGLSREERLRNAAFKKLVAAQGTVIKVREKVHGGGAVTYREVAKRVEAGSGSGAGGALTEGDKLDARVKQQGRDKYCF